MNYELAKQLKDAGFQHNWGQEDTDLGFAPFGYPTLSDLVEACGEGQLRLQRYGKEDKTPFGEDLNGAWHVFNHLDTCLCTHDAGGDTPEEAVANLWLAIHKSN